MSTDPQRPARLLRRRRDSRGRVVHPAVNTLEPDLSPMSAASGEQLPTRREQHTGSFEQVFDAHYERLVRALTVVAGDRDVAADAVQDAFVKAHLRWSRISRYDDPVGWVRRVAVNKLRNEHRSTKRKWRAIHRLGERHETAHDDHEIDEFGRLLARLPKQQRLTTALFYVDNLTLAEIAQTLGISEGTVKSHLHDARRRLRPILENEARS